MLADEWDWVRIREDPEDVVLHKRDERENKETSVELQMFPWHFPWRNRTEWYIQRLNSDYEHHMKKYWLFPYYSIQIIWNKVDDQIIFNLSGIFSFIFPFSVPFFSTYFTSLTSPVVNYEAYERSPIFTLLLAKQTMA